MIANGASRSAANAVVSECLATARMPVEGAELEIRAYGFGDEADVIALVHDRGVASEEALVRIHSCCLTGEAFGSLRCDCGPQLAAALAAIQNEDLGIILYLVGHEGRGIGLLNKIRAYALQDQGLDTVEANTALGFAPDARDYAGAAAALHAIGVRRIRLLSNNPAKATGLEQHGIVVTEKIAMTVPVNEHNRRYLDTKHVYFGHAALGGPRRLPP